jgi:hypothetical protein
MDPRASYLWGAIIVSVVTLLTYAGALVVSFFFKDSGLLYLIVGAAIANAMTAVGFWLGSSSGSQKKDDIIRELAARPDFGLSAPTAAPLAMTGLSLSENEIIDTGVRDPGGSPRR